MFEVGHPCKSRSLSILEVFLFLLHFLGIFVFVLCFPVIKFDDLLVMIVTMLIALAIIVLVAHHMDCNRSRWDSVGDHDQTILAAGQSVRYLEMGVMNRVSRGHAH